MMLARELAVGLLDLVGRGVLGNAEGVVQASPSLTPRRSRAPAGAPCRRAGSPSAAPAGPSLPRRPRPAGRGAPRGRADRTRPPCRSPSARAARAAPASERCTSWTPSSSLASSCCAAASSARSRSSSTGSSSFSEPLVRALGQLGVLAGDPLAVVVEVGGEPEVGVVRSRRIFGRRLLDDLLEPRPRRARDSSVTTSSPLPLVDDLVVGVLDDLVLGGRAAVAGRRRLRLRAGLRVDARPPACGTPR